MDEIRGYHETPIRVQFGQVDRYGYLWHGHALSYFEIARADLVRNFELSASALLKEKLAVPMIELSCEYRNPAYDDERLAIQSTLVRPSDPTPYLNFIYRVVRMEGHEEILRGKTRQLIMRPDGRLLIRVPATIRERMEKLWNYLATQKRWVD